MVVHVKIPSYWTAQSEKWAFTKWDKVQILMHLNEWALLHRVKMRGSMSGCDPDYAGTFLEKMVWTTGTLELFVHFTYSEKSNEEIKTTPTNIMMSNLLLPVSSFLFFQSLSCPASSSGPFLQSVPVPPLAPARPPAPVPGLATQTKTHCLAQFNWLV